MHDVDDLIQLFNRCFELEYQTRLIKGGMEPIYRPADDECAYHRIIFTFDYFSSALHECAHWFIAGEKRRQCVDYGYWYAPDGRSVEQQRRFQEVEIKPQALEWILSVAACYPFQVSFDNLNGETSDAAPFQQAILQQVQRYHEHGLPRRAEQFYRALTAFYTPRNEGARL
jgi:hypothetical protein